MEVDSDTGSARGAAGLSTDQKGDVTDADVAGMKELAGCERTGEGEGAGESGAGGAEDAPSPAPGRSNKRARVVVGAVPGEEIRPVAAPVQEPFLEVPEVSEADVGKMVISETSEGTLTGVVESFAESEDGLGVWSIRWVVGGVGVVFAATIVADVVVSAAVGGWCCFCCVAMQLLRQLLVGWAGGAWNGCLSVQSCCFVCRRCLREGVIVAQLQLDQFRTKPGCLG